MQVYCRGGTTMQKRLAKNVARYCASKLMSTRLANSLCVTIHFVSEPESPNDGDVIFEDDFDCLRPKEFSMNINIAGNGIAKQLKTVCHEMVHVKQYAKGEMRYMWRPHRHTKFLGELYSDDKVDYWDQPWEVEAFGREVGLYTRWLDDAGLTGNDVFDTRHREDTISEEESELLAYTPYKKT